MHAIAEAAERAARTVDRLCDYGQQIGDIVMVIDDIASQTNLLAPGLMEKRGRFVIRCARPYSGRHVSYRSAWWPVVGRPV